MDLKRPGPSAADAEQSPVEEPVRAAEFLSFEPLPQPHRSRRRAVPRLPLLAYAVAGGLAVGVVGTYLVKDDLRRGQRTDAPAASVAGYGRVRVEASSLSANALSGSPQPGVNGMSPAAAPPADTAPTALTATPSATAGAGRTATPSSGPAGNQAPDQGAASETAASPDVANAKPNVSSPSNAATLGSSKPSAMIGIAMARGDEALARGDVISARQFYELASTNSPHRSALPMRRPLSDRHTTQIF
jgi:hypothetical protein